MKHLSIVLGLFTVSTLFSCQKEIQSRSDANVTESNIAAEDDAGDVYTISNSSPDNKVFHFDRAADGTLTLEGKYSTNGGGSGALFPLGSQGSVMLSDDK